jgi:molybdenum cofactor cytidylyltransferase
MARVPHLLLAAGSSSRMGQPKQLLPWGEKTLIEHQIQTRLQTNQDIHVVLGCHSEKILPFIEKLPVTVYVNNHWAEGLGNSISFAAKMLIRKNEKLDGILISLLDQPLVTAEYLKKMLGSFQPEKKQIIVSESSSGWRGVPVLFDKFYFNELTHLNGEEGAKNIIKKHQQNVESISCQNILEDIDTPEAYQKLLNRYNG